MTSSRESFPPQESEELRRFLSEAAKENRDHKTLRECLPALQVQSLVDMKIHEQMGGSPVNRSFRGSYAKELHSDTDSNYDKPEFSPLDHNYDDSSPNISPISHQHIPDRLRIKALSFNGEPSSSLASPRFHHRISNLDERILLNETQTNTLSNFLGHHANPNINNDKDNASGADYLSDCRSEISALKFRIVELEYVNAALESKVRQYRDEIRLFKKDVKGYKNDGRRFTQQLKEKNLEITELHTKIIQLLNNDTLVSPQTVTSNSSGFSTKVSTANSKQRKGSKASDDWRTRSRMAGHDDDGQSWI
ncbi:hypothetical protein PISL3812_02409 [Talaromyces islandicus]|uniref:Uncharacterized protein n=1 Tax=Talaromyces islandicus TaxID=28573 RepID=A0A0U1LQK7_TALIS|nr:hypothetical protein PISL3812_02409 [Talaromyces islandicus]